MTLTKSTFPYPISIGTLEHFCHPREGDPFEFPRWHDGHALAACSYIALRATKGHWMPSGSDFTPADPAFLDRFNALPWASFDPFTTDARNWKNLRDAAPLFHRHGPLALWLNNRPAPSPVWQVAEIHLVRLSHLQHISRLPRCEVYTGHSTHLHFRFSGGTGIIAKDDRLTTPSWEILRPHRDYTGEKTARNAPTFGGLEQPGWNWPPKGEEIEIVRY